jgi:photosystem II stability/assembly factor-like uncharacterized protein
MAAGSVSARTASIVVLLAALFAFVSSPAQASAPLTTPNGLWTWVRPLPFGYQLNWGAAPTPFTLHAISAPSPGTLFVATTASDALVTRDGGAAWSWSPTDLPHARVPGLLSITFISPSEGWAGGYGVLLHTRDGGQTWQTQLTAPELPFILVTFADATSGWAVAGGDYPRVYATRDGGQTWAEVALPFLYSTFNTLVAQGPGQALLAAEEWSMGTATGDDLGTSLWRTSDYGAHWTARVLLKKVRLEDIAFVSPMRGWAVGGATLWGTTDGGTSWQKVPHTATPGGYASIQCIGNDVWAVGSGRILHSPDAGKSWRSLPGVRLPHPVSVSFADGQDGWIATGGAWLHTTDGAKSWQRITSAPKSGVSKLAAVPGGTVWGAAGYVIRSADGGRHWQRVTQRSHLTAVAAASAGQAWAVGPRGLIIHTADGGRHWRVQPSGTVRDLADVFFVDAEHGWVGGTNETLRRTVDGGRHWTKANSGVGTSISKIEFVDARHGIALSGFTSHVLTTTDGGRHWSKTRFSQSPYLAKAVSMKDAAHWLVVSTFDHTWTTSDGGQSWQQGADLPPASGDQVDIARSGSRLCVLDWSGDTATSTNDGATWSSDEDLRGLVRCAQFVGDHTLLAGGDAGILTRDLSRAPLR